ncbi:MAG: septum formation initiator family protein [Candidatus Komeilibacteria bacterium]|nr:septum formation initiator family protein [Candidatus Komeilibacteria bacterium]
MWGNKNLGRRFLSSKILLIASLFVLIFFSVNLAKEIINRRDLQQEINKYLVQLDDLNKSNQDLSGSIEYFKTMAFVENEARTKLNLKKPGEQIIIVPEEKTPGQAAANTSLVNGLADQTASQPNYLNWWNYFFNQNL